MVHGGRVGPLLLPVLLAIRLTTGHCTPRADDGLPKEFGSMVVGDYQQMGCSPPSLNSKLMRDVFLDCLGCCDRWGRR